MAKTTPTRHPGVMRKGGDWWIQATATAPNGRRVFRRRLLPGTMPVSEVVKARADLVMALEAELRKIAPPAQPPPEVLTVAGYVLRWLVARRARLRPSTVARYLIPLDSILVPFFGFKPAAHLTRTDIQELAAHVEAQRRPDGQPYSEATLAGWWRVFRTVLSDLAAEVAIADPCARVAPPRSTVRDRRELRTLTADQVHRLLAACEVRHPAWLAEVTTAALTGARVGELHALEWRDLDATAATITIARAVWSGIVGETKTRRSRVIAVPRELVAMLAVHRASQAPDTPLMFPSETGGYRFPASLQKVLQECAEVADLGQRVTPQVLRRTLNTLMIQAGAPGELVRSVLGHTTTAMTGRYFGAQVEAQRAALVASGVTLEER